MVALLRPHGLHAQAQLPPTASANDNRTSAGVLVKDTLKVSLVAGMARWYPEADSGAFLEVAAFAVAGAAPQVPAPLLRVPAGTYVQAEIRNRLADTLLVVGFGGPHDTLRVAPGATQSTGSRHAAAGSFAYYAHTRSAGKLMRHGPGEQLFGALVVDDANPSSDRVLVLKTWNGPPNAFTRDPIVMAINGKSWPFTERLTMEHRDTLRLRVINGSNAEHPMHLHGFYYRLDALGTWHADARLPAAEKPQVVTHTLREGQTMALTWVAERPGRWLFHCHNAFHMDGSQHQDLAGIARVSMAAHQHGDTHAEEAMAGLVMGVVVNGEDVVPTVAGADRRRIEVRARDGYFADTTAANYYTFDAGDGRVRVPGPALEIEQGRKTAVTVVNHLDVPTAVHWHGQEIASYYDGVAGWSRTGDRTAPLIAPADSFTAVLEAPRAGTFIYHSHFDDINQVNSGLVAPLLVMPRGTTRDLARDHAWIVHVLGTSATAAVALNGGQTRMELAAGVAHRIRVIIITSGDEVDMALLAGSDTVTWRALAKDGADLPPALQREVPAQLHAGAGETLDFEWTPQVGTYTLKVRSYNNFDVDIVAR